MTKKELEKEVEKLKRSNAALKGQITKLEATAEKEPKKVPDPELRSKVRTLVNAIERKGLANQIGNHSEVDEVRALIA